MREYKKLWWLLLAVLAVTFAVLGWSGVEVYKQVPPIPQQVVTQSGKVLMTHDDILDGQTAWQSTGGMQVGSIWGHGAYQAPDWTADWLHRELLAWLDLAARDAAGVPFDHLDADKQAALKSQLKSEYRRNTWIRRPAWSPCPTGARRRLRKPRNTTRSCTVPIRNCARRGRTSP